ncbi:MAG: trypsin-like serine protease [bacterium]|nr:trypsin-like serine protease [bacterium]
MPRTSTTAGFAIAIASAFFGPGARAQAAPLPITNRPVVVDSGYLGNPGSTANVVFHHDLVIEDAHWLRLVFGPTNLPSGSTLRLTSLHDGAIQHFDAASLRDYGFASAYFNGKSVRLELIAGPGTVGNRVSLQAVELESRDAPRPDSICGNTDDRTLFTDARIGRGVSGASACTWWLISECVIITAGHCTSSISTPAIIGFNIPLSTGSGTMVHPPPDDQYPAIVPTLQRENSGIGRDWAVMRMGRNSNHGQYPGEKQGAWFELGNVPGPITGVDIRITGNGRVSTPVSPTWNAVTKTHLGPRISTTRADALRYQTDTTGGNSGSPIIHEQTGHAIGVHTHGGCNASGGGNYGTRIDKPVFANAISSALSQACGTFSLFGQGCGGAGGAPQLTMSGLPDIGQTANVDLTNLPPQQFGLVGYGFSDTVYQGNTLPLALGAFGLTGCTLYASPEFSVFVPTNNGSNTFALVLPNAPALVGLDLFVQYFVTDPTATGGAGVTNAAQIHVGA